MSVMSVSLPEKAAPYGHVTGWVRYYSSIMDPRASIYLSLKKFCCYAFALNQSDNSRSIFVLSTYYGEWDLSGLADW